MSDNNNEESSSREHVSPPWGTLPSEIYLLEHYDSESTLSPSDQAKSLIRAYIRSGAKTMQEPAQIPVPTPQQIAFLKAWRPLSIRDLAFDRGTVWVRTFYSPETDAKHDALISEINILNAVYSEERILNDASLYGGFGEKWEGLFELLPELIVNDRCGTWTEYQACIADAGRKALQQVTDVFQRLGAEETVTIEEQDRIAKTIERHKTFRPGEKADPLILDFLEIVHEECVVNYVIIEDRTTLDDEGELLLLAFVDAWGRLVKRKRIGNSVAEHLGDLWLQISCNETYIWETADFGEDYREGGGWEDLLQGAEAQRAITMST